MEQYIIAVDRNLLPIVLKINNDKLKGFPSLSTAVIICEAIKCPCCGFAICVNKKIEEKEGEDK